jgi:hypothetical protein
MLAYSRFLIRLSQFARYVFSAATARLSAPTYTPRYLGLPERSGLVLRVIIDSELVQHFGFRGSSRRRKGTASHILTWLGHIARLSK